MRRAVWWLLLGCLVLTRGDVTAAPATSASSPEWSVNVSNIEACSCPMFCQCYFNAEPAAHYHGGG